MRLALLGLAASLSTLPLVGQELRLSQSPVTITATFVRTGTPTISSGASIDTAGFMREASGLAESFASA